MWVVQLTPGSYADLALRINVSAMLDVWTQGAQAQHQESGDQAGTSSFGGVCLVFVTCSHALCSHKLVTWSSLPALAVLEVFSVFLCSALIEKV